jgi:hypothetical protein
MHSGVASPRGQRLSQSPVDHQQSPQIFGDILILLSNLKKGSLVGPKSTTDFVCNA